MPNTEMSTLVPARHATMLAQSDLLRLLEIEHRQIHIALGEDMNRNHALARGQVKFRKMRRDVPVMPLPLRHRILGVESGFDQERACC